MNVLTTFGDYNKYRMLKYLAEKINELPKADQSYLSKFISNFNKLLKEPYSTYVLYLIKNDYINKAENMKYDKKIISYLKNYINAKIKNYKKQSIPYYLEKYFLEIIKIALKWKDNNDLCKVPPYMINKYDPIKPINKEVLIADLIEFDKKYKSQSNGAWL